MFRSVSASLPLSIACYSNRFFTYVFTEYHMRPHSSIIRLAKIFPESSPNLPQIFRTSAESLLEISLKFSLVFFKFSEQVWECGIHNFFWFFYVIWFLISVIFLYFFIIIDLLVLLVLLIYCIFCKSRVLCFQNRK